MPPHGEVAVRGFFDTAHFVEREETDPDDGELVAGSGAGAGIQRRRRDRIPAFAGMTEAE